MTDIPDGFEPAQFTKGFLDQSGPYYLKEVADGTIVGLRVQKSHVNYIKVAHGGVLTTLADVALSLQVHQSEIPNLPVSTVSLTTNFLSGAKLDEWIEATAIIDRIGKKLAYVSGAICSGDRTIMTMSGVFNVFRSK
ncbi:MAG: PaaI family thioesterase [Parasphingorhabdus sp.]